MSAILLARWVLFDTWGWMKFPANIELLCTEGGQRDVHFSLIDGLGELSSTV